MLMKWIFSCFLVSISLNVYGVATRNDWHVFPMTDSNVQIPLELVFNKQEFTNISEGFIPNVMEDKWVIIVENSHIFIYRSWTGIMIYDCSFEDRGDEILISSMFANRNLKEYLNTDNEFDVFQVEYLLRWLAYPTWLQE